MFCVSSLSPFRSVQDKNEKEKEKSYGRREEESEKGGEQMGIGRAEIRGVHVQTIISGVVVVVVADNCYNNNNRKTSPLSPSY